VSPVTTRSDNGSADVLHQPDRGGLGQFFSTWLGTAARSCACTDEFLQGRGV
jgi:hypothetical protein